MKSKQNQLKLTLMGFVFVLMGCNANKVGMQLVEQDSSASTQSVCNRFAASRFSGNIYTYYTAANKLITNQIRLEFTKLSSEFADTNKKLALSFQAYGYDSNGKIVRTASALSFNFEYRPGGKGDGNGINVLASDVQSFTATDMNNLMAKLRSDTGLTINTIQQAFAYYDVVIKNIDSIYDVLQIVTTDSSGATLVASTTSLLLTPFAINPDTYASTHVADLMRYHPFATAQGSYRSDDAYADAAYQLCL